ncbi:MAG: zf-HC2 domain-containing protein, partial [Thermoguttaceae bacterium]
MPREHPCCNPDRIEQLLEGRLTTEEQLQVENHLDGCATCRNRLETTAAEQTYWQEAAIHLRNDALDEETGTGRFMGFADSDGSASDEKV